MKSAFIVLIYTIIAQEINEKSMNVESKPSDARSFDGGNLRFKFYDRKKNIDEKCIHKICVPVVYINDAMNAMFQIIN